MIKLLPESPGGPAGPAGPAGPGGPGIATVLEAEPAQEGKKGQMKLITSRRSSGNYYCSDEAKLWRVSWL